jgi:hypothetical protein
MSISLFIKDETTQQVEIYELAGYSTIRNLLVPAAKHVGLVNLAELPQEVYITDGNLATVTKEMEQLIEYMKQEPQRWGFVPQNSERILRKFRELREKQSWTAFFG